MSLRNNTWGKALGETFLQWLAAYITFIVALFVSLNFGPPKGSWLSFMLAAGIGNPAGLCITLVKFSAYRRRVVWRILISGLVSLPACWGATLLGIWLYYNAGNAILPSALISAAIVSAAACAAWRLV